MPDGLVAAADRLGGRARDASRGEALLLHGTAPEHLHSILFEGLDGSLANNGLFGRNTAASDDGVSALIICC